MTIKNVSTVVFGCFIVLALSFAVATPAKAAVNFDGIAPVIFEAGNGWESNVDVDAGDTIRAKLILDITADDDVNAVSYDFIGDFIPKVCIQLPQEQTQSVNDFPVELDMLAPNTAGSWDVQFAAYGNNGPETDFNCTNSVDTLNVNDRIIVNLGDSNTAGSTGGGSGTVGNSVLASLMSQVKLLADAVAKLSAPTTPAPSGKCAAVSAKLVGTMDNTYNQANVQLQGYLLSEGMSIPALAAGASFGYKGPQTNAALAQFKAMNQCI